jgi:ArsR family transcriptional regulator
MQKKSAPSNRTAACCRLGSRLEPELFKALGDPRRAAILLEMAGQQGPTRVSDIAACCPTDLSVVSRHLATLRDAGVVEATRTGREVHYRVRYRALAAAVRRLADALESCCPERAEPRTGEES